MSKVARASGRAGPRGKAGLGARRKHPTGFAGARRVIVKARIVRMTASSAGALANHLRYISRDGAVQAEARGHLFNGAEEDLDKSSFCKKADQDRHHFRFIISPEDAGEMQDLKPFVRDLMREMESDLGTRLDWAAAIHHDTAHPHAHIVVRGRRQDGGDLVMPRSYISHQIRRRASDLVTLELGPETRMERTRKLASEIRHQRLTRIDRALLKQADVHHRLDLTNGPPVFRQINAARLRVLEKLRLATHYGGSKWTLDPDLDRKLKTLGERGDIIKTLNRAVALRPDRRIDPDFAARIDPAITGAIVKLKASGPFHDKMAAIIDTLDGRLVNAALDPETSHGRLKPGMIVDLQSQLPKLKPSDHTINRIADAHDRRYSPALHQAIDPSASPDFIAAHIRRLESMRRAGVTERASDGVWHVPNDYLDRVMAFETEKAARLGLQAQVASALSLDAQIEEPGLTWLDRQAPFSEVQYYGFGAEAARAKQQRQAHLVKQGVLSRSDQTLSAAQRSRLRAVSIASAARNVAGQTGKAHLPLPRQGQIEGVYSGAIETGAGRLAIIEQHNSFTLAPWRKVLEPHRGRAISGLVKQGKISWQFGAKRQRGLTR